jgi:hypothetical protein
MSRPVSSSQADPPKRQRAEQRRWVRMPCQPGTRALVVISENEYPWSAEVRNISPGGVGVVLARKLEPERTVLVDLHNEANGFRCQMPARVVYTADLPGGDVLHGCKFARELSDLEVRGLIA